MKPLTFQATQGKLLSCALVISTLTACSTAPKIATGISDIRAELSALQANNELAVLAPVAITEAEAAVRAAEQPAKNADLSSHLVFVADRKVNIAWAQAQSRFAQDQLKVLAKARDEARLDSRTREANLAQQDARAARSDAVTARQETDAARRATSTAQTESDNAQQLAAELQAQIKLLNARQSERGWVVTLGDVLFDTGKANLKSATSQHLTDLALFLGKYPLRGAIIEGHTDNVGSSGYNMGLSQQRADSVRNFLIGRGIQSGRLSSLGKGEDMPVAGNESASGRQQNRRVEVIITEAALASR
ncbi:OmpA family protein [Rheinheimera texasensis]|uniref:OmpA family protein n=1 Tax=Rheinheimera texasensis TaxID=306205 RepID=UPI0032B18E17